MTFFMGIILSEWDTGLPVVVLYHGEIFLSIAAPVRLGDFITERRGGLWYDKATIRKEEDLPMKFLALLILAALTLTGGGAASKAPDAAYRQISQEEAASLMESEEDYVILDVRTPEEFADGHISGAVNLPNESIGTEALPQLPDKDQMLLVYCRSGNRSRQASEKLAALGYTNILEFGGINTWTGPTERD